VGPAFIVGGWGVISTSCAIGVCAIYFGLIVLFLEVTLEPWIIKKAPLPLHIGLIAVCLFLFDWFTIGFVAASTPINFSSFETTIDYSGRNAPAGIAWEPFFTELDFIVTNPSDGNYENVDLLVRPDFPVARIAQLSNLKDVSLEDRYGVNVRATIEEIGKQSPTPVEFLATDAGYKVHCSSIPPNSSLNLIMAIVDFKKVLPQDISKPLKIPQGEDLSHFTIPVTIKNSEGVFTYWFASGQDTRRYAPKPIPKKVHVVISYTANHCRNNRTLEKLVDAWQKP
jgi:hypothetical protein